MIVSGHTSLFRFGFIQIPTHCQIQRQGCDGWDYLLLKRITYSLSTRQWPFRSIRRTQACEVTSIWWHAKFVRKGAPRHQQSSQSLLPWPQTPQPGWLHTFVRALLPSSSVLVEGCEFGQAGTKRRCSIVFVLGHVVSHCFRRFCERPFLRY